jgi:hypothetical protein
MEELQRGALAERALDVAHEAAVADELTALATTDMEISTLQRYMEMAPTAALPWQIGEALAEILLAEWHGAVWVWNGARDRKVSAASLPGADLVGFASTSTGVRFLLGEVKSSSDTASPPHVLYGKTGMVRQLENLAAGRELWTLVKWLRARCTSDEHAARYRDAARTWLGGEAESLHLVGCLIRDTAPVATDLEARGIALSGSISEAIRVELYAWYVPIAMDKWPSLIEGS